MHFPAKTLPQESEDQKRIEQNDILSFRWSYRFEFKGQNYLGELEVSLQVLWDVAIKAVNPIPQSEMRTILGTKHGK